MLPLQMTGEEADQRLKSSSRHYCWLIGKRSSGVALIIGGGGEFPQWHSDWLCSQGSRQVACARAASVARWLNWSQQGIGIVDIGKDVAAVMDYDVWIRKTIGWWWVLPLIDMAKAEVFKGLVVSVKPKLKFFFNFGSIQYLMELPSTGTIRTY